MHLSSSLILNKIINATLLFLTPFFMSWTAPWFKDLYTIPGSWKHPSSCMASILTGHVPNWACLGCSGSAYRTACSSSCLYPTTSHTHWRGVDQHSTGHNQQPDQLYAKEMCCTAWCKWWSHQILASFWSPPDPPNTVKLHILEWPFTVANLMHTLICHTCEVDGLSRQRRSAH